MMRTSNIPLSVSSRELKGSSGCKSAIGRSTGPLNFSLENVELRSFSYTFVKIITDGINELHNAEGSQLPLNVHTRASTRLGTV